MVELLSPVGDFECLKAAVQNGADSVYFGGSLFNARASATNFDNTMLKKAVEYAKLRNVKVNFTLNTLVKDDEFKSAVELAKYVYTLGTDAIIVQDLGLAKYIISNMPEIDVHASTQMTIHNLQGVLALEKLGFKRVVLARELNLSEIEYICANSNIEIETFVHGALCISYSGQCLFSSTIGARSGNRGRCAQPCRLPYSLIDEKQNVLDNGYLLSPRDLCSLEYIPRLINAGVSSFKIEGRMKTPEYVATVTKIYRKYIDLALSDKEYKVHEEDIKRLMQVFNRGGFSSGNFEDDENLNYVYKEKPNNMGLYIGNVSSFNKSRGLITLKTTESLSMKDQISLEKEAHKYTISEIMSNGKNIPVATPNTTVTIGRIKGNISLGDKVYKLSSNSFSKEIKEFYEKEHIKIPLSCKIIIKKGKKVSLEVSSLDTQNYSSMLIKKSLDIIPIDSINNPISKERVIYQLNKTNNTQFEFKEIDVELDSNAFLPKISAINELRRECLNELERVAIQRFERKLNNLTPVNHTNTIQKTDLPSISLLLNELNTYSDYSLLNNVDKIYIPLKYFNNKQYFNILSILSSKGDLYIYMPHIIKDNYRNIIYNSLDKLINTFNIKGIVISNISNIYCLNKYINDLQIIGNYTLNVFNTNTIYELKELGLNCITLSPELDRHSLINLSLSSPIPIELMCYGRLPIMNMGYCLLGKSNKCYPICDAKCMSNHKFYLKDRLGYTFRFIPDNMQTVTTIYNSKITSIPFDEINVTSIRISILDENIDSINNIIDKVKAKECFSGKEYTNGNFNKFV